MVYGFLALHLKPLKITRSLKISKAEVEGHNLPKDFQTKIWRALPRSLGGDHQMMENPTRICRWPPDSPAGIKLNALLLSHPRWGAHLEPLCYANPVFKVQSQHVHSFSSRDVSGCTGFGVEKPKTLPFVTWSTKVPKLVPSMAAALQKAAFNSLVLAIQETWRLSVTTE